MEGVYDENGQFKVPLNTDSARFPGGFRCISPDTCVGSAVHENAN